jgi:UDP-2,3-diacylglucosamine pyrophosphatase LpxH
MLAVISDLHFEEEALDKVSLAPNSAGLTFVRNLPPGAYQMIIARLADEAEHNGATHLDLVLAGDVFDLHRTLLWFGTDDGNGGLQPTPDPVRPYVANTQVTPALESKVLEILDAIANEKRVAGALEVFKLLWQGLYVPTGGDPSHPVQFPLAADRIRCVYLPGNHDRLANATPRIRERVRHHLGLPASNLPFPHTHTSDDPRVIVRHGHEYDAFNFGADYGRRGADLDKIPLEHYEAPTFGDFVTIDIVGALPWRMRQHYGLKGILGSRALAAIYKRLLEFDDVRPQSRLLDFVLATPDTGVSQERLWELLRPVLVNLLDGIRDDPFLRKCLAGMKPANLTQRMALAAVRTALKLRIWRRGLPLSVVRSLLDKVAGGGDGPAAFATREPSIHNSDRRFVVAGHTHSPDVVPIGKASSEQVYVDTGTWRNKVLPMAAGEGFVRLKSLSYLTVFGSDEDGGRTSASGGRQESFDFWSGFAEKWS